MEKENSKPNHENSANDENRPEKRSFQLKRRPEEENDYNKRSYNSSSYGNNDRKPYGNRENYGNREGGYGNRENRPYGGNSRYGDGERKNYSGNNDSRYGNERRSYGNNDRKPYGNRESYGNREGGYGNRENYGNREGGYGNRENRPYNSNYQGNRSYNNSNRYDSNSPRKPYQQQDTNRYDENNKKVVFRKRKNAQEGEEPRRRNFQAYREEVDLTKPMRLNKFLANAGVCSRREADEFIQAGVITVNGEVVTELGTKILPVDKVMFHDQIVRSERKIYLILNKPKDFVTTVEDTHDRKIVMDLVKNACSERIYPVGRLDRNTTGVLLFTNDGDLAAKLTHPKYEKKKIYQVTLDKDLEQPDFDQILAGVPLEDGTIAADDLAFVKEDNKRIVGIEIHSGKNRVVRRIFDRLGYRVIRLDRVYFAGLTKKNLPRGRYRFLTGKEIASLKMGAYE